MEDKTGSQELIDGAINNVSKETSKRRGSLHKSLFKNRHKVHCVTPDEDAFIEDRTKYDEHVVSLPSKPPAPSYTNTVRYKFSIEEEKPEKREEKPVKPRRKKEKKKKSNTSEIGTNTEIRSTTETGTNTATDSETETDTDTGSEDSSKHSEPPDPPKKKYKLQITTPNIVAYIHELPPKSQPELRITSPELVTYLHTSAINLIQTPIKIVAYFPTPPNLALTSIDSIDIPAMPPGPAKDNQDLVVIPIKEDTPEGSDVKVILMHIEKLMQLCMSVHGQCPADNSQILAFIKEVHQDLIERLNALRLQNEQRKEEEDQKKPCLCAWLRIHISTSEQDSYMYTVNPRCPRCTLCQQGRQLLKAAGLKPDGFKDLWLPLGTLVLCLETDDDDMFADVLEKEIPDELITKVDGTQMALPPGLQEEGPGAISSKWYRGDVGLTSVFRLLVFMGKLWEAPRCVLLLLKWLKTPASILQEVERLERNITIHNSNPNPISDKVTHINIVNNQAFGDKHIKAEMEIKCIFIAAKKRNVAAFKILLDGPSNSLFPKGVKMVDLKTDKEPLPENSVDEHRAEEDRRTVFELLIDLCYDSCQQNGKEEDCLLEMLDYIYDPAAIRKWSRLGEPARKGNEPTKHDDRTREALSDLILGEPGEKATTMLDYAAKNGTGGVVKRILGNHPYRRPDKDNQSQNMHCYLADGLEKILQKLNKRASKEVIGPILEVEPLRTMVDDKWACYKPYYIGCLLWYLTFMTIFTLCAAFRPINALSIPAMYQTTEDYFRLLGEILVILGICVLFYTIVKEVWAFMALRTFPKPWNRYDLYVYVNILLVILAVVVVVLRLVLNENEDIFLALALFCGWTNVVHRVAAFKRTGMFAIIMHHCIMKDFIPGFIWVFLILLLGLSTATFTVYQTAPENIPDFPNSTYWTTPFSLFKLTFGLLETEYATETRWGGIGIVLFLLYLYLMNIVLFNLLISMLGNTYQNVYDVVNQHWIQIRLSYVLLVERWWPHLKLHYNGGAESRCSSLACGLSRFCPKPKGVYEKVGITRYVFVPTEQEDYEKEEIYIM